MGNIMNTMNTETTRIRNSQMPLRRREALLLVVLSCLADSVSASGKWNPENRDQWYCTKHMFNRDDTCRYRTAQQPYCDGTKNDNGWGTCCQVRRPRPGSRPPAETRRRMAQREFSNRRDSPVMVRLLQEIVEANERHNRSKGNEGF